MRLRNDPIFPIKFVETRGVVFRTNCCVGRDLSPEALAAEFDLAIFCCGAQQPRPLPFAEAGGVFYALDYLRASAQALLAQAGPAVTAAGKHVVLVGAGDSASDCVSVALRQGCRSLTQLIRTSRWKRKRMIAPAAYETAMSPAVPNAL